MEIVCDLDGTLADCRWRLHHVKEKNWNAFYDGISEDTVVQPIFELLQASDSFEIIFITGRPEKYRNQTKNWLRKFAFDPCSLYMRKDGDFRPDYVVKAELLNAAISDGYRPTLAIEDRPEVAEAYRNFGLTVLEHKFPQPRGGATPPSSAILSLLVGPSGAGKTSWLSGLHLGPNGEKPSDYGLSPRHVVSTDDLREDLTGDFKNQSKNDQVFDTLHKIVKQRLELGLPVCVDATNLHRKNRLEIVKLAPAAKIRYFVINRPVEQKRATGGWRNELKDYDLILRHEKSFYDSLGDILKGDGISGVEIIDLRSK